MVETTIGIEGMMCSMCEAHIQDCVRHAFPVRSAKASRHRKSCVIVSDEPLDEGRLRAAIAATGYEMTSFAASPYHKRGLFGR